MRFSLFILLLAVSVWTVAASDPQLHPRARATETATLSKKAADPSSTKKASKTASKTASKASPTKASASAASSAAPSTKASAKPTSTSTSTPKKSSSSKGTKARTIGLAVGIPIGVLAIAGSLAAFILGRRRGRKRRVDDPTAGAGKKIRDPSDELDLSASGTTTPPGAVELPARGSWKVGSPRGGSGGWWKGVGLGRWGSGTERRGQYATAPGSPGVQELPA